MKIWMFVIVVFSLATVQVKAKVFEYKAGDISFDVGSLKYNDKSSRKEPLSLVFQAGEPPFSISVQFRIESKNKALDDFIENEKQNQSNGGYSDEITISEQHTDKYNSVEYIRNSPLGIIHWFVFQKVSTRQIYSFWFMESKGLQAETKQALSAYESMKSTLK
ncbi:hypothetical protein C9J44_15615 [Photobacterium sp. GB-27]|uniref:hypothetical protein n=1 Tax=unclassified Photobacterium TaxID=2628852 RepID=UPI000D15BBE9|nr:MULTISPECIES: hypothetical protein [unclassified Photobacterium]PSV30678.1 hypothetical protein C9J40_11965 [Photobacterium sp. GB-72]PSV34363.1 hypothetical protein C9J44_15615 [Photobacterium sp. GB-27]